MADIEGQAQEVLGQAENYPARRLKPKSTNHCQVKGCDYNRKKRSTGKARIGAFSFPKIDFL